jgi:hypothetical protein
MNLLTTHYIEAWLMNEDIRKILSQITQLEDELHSAIQEQQVELRYVIEGTKVRFEDNIRNAHRKLRTGYLRWMRQSQPRNVVTAPVIYSLIIPFLLVDICVSLYQAICFPLYRVPKVCRSTYVVVDRHSLAYLNSIEKLNCIYCGYVGGVIAYTREVAARTEQYWCPIKHSRALLDPHRRYARFADYGEGENYIQTMNRMRAELESELRSDSDSGVTS